MVGVQAARVVSSRHVYPPAKSGLMEIGGRGSSKIPNSVKRHSNVLTNDNSKLMKSLHTKTLENKVLKELAKKLKVSEQMAKTEAKKAKRETTSTKKKARTDGQRDKLALKKAKNEIEQVKQDAECLQSEVKVLESQTKRFEADMKDAERTMSSLFDGGSGKFDDVEISLSRRGENFMKMHTAYRDALTSQTSLKRLENRISELEGKVDILQVEKDELGKQKERFRLTKNEQAAS